MERINPYPHLSDLRLFLWNTSWYGLGNGSWERLGDNTLRNDGNGLLEWYGNH